MNAKIGRARIAVVAFSRRWWYPDTCIFQGGVDADCPGEAVVFLRIPENLLVEMTGLTLMWRNGGDLQRSLAFTAWTLTYETQNGLLPFPHNRFETPSPGILGSPSESYEKEFQQSLGKPCSWIYSPSSRAHRWNTRELPLHHDGFPTLPQGLLLFFLIFRDRGEHMSVNIYPKNSPFLSILIDQTSGDRRRQRGRI
jgi:hypothetical protein